jgi:hypothetical protein
VASGSQLRLQEEDPARGESRVGEVAEDAVDPELVEREVLADRISLEVAGEALRLVAKCERVDEASDPVRVRDDVGRRKQDAVPFIGAFTRLPRLQAVLMR